MTRENGMVVFYNLRKRRNRPLLPPRSLLPGSHVRTYYIAAQKIKWEYVDRKIHPVILDDLTDPSMYFLVIDTFDVLISNKRYKSSKKL